ncbi:hypothetical protein BC629DRAFT_1597519 [Irpex lacteus]|nr:hypothetical protein BC629DRAFT_1597519 [Irpex lacteus]
MPGVAPRRSRDIDPSWNNQTASLPPHHRRGHNSRARARQTTPGTRSRDVDPSWNGQTGLPARKTRRGPRKVGGFDAAVDDCFELRASRPRSPDGDALRNDQPSLPPHHHERRLNFEPEPEPGNLDGDLLRCNLARGTAICRGTTKPPSEKAWMIGSSPPLYPSQKALLRASRPRSPDDDPLRNDETASLPPTNDDSSLQHANPRQAR